MNPCEKNTDFFNGLAGEWDEVCPPPSDEFLLSIVSLADLNENSFVLDVGAGTGAIIPALIKTVTTGKIVAMDPAKNMLDVLKKKFPEERVTTRCETLEDSSLDDSSTDAVICFACFPHIADKTKAMRNARRMMKSGAKMVIAHASSRDEMNHFHASCSEPVKHDVLPDEKEMTRLLDDAGFKIVHFKDEPGRYELVAQKTS